MTANLTRYPAISVPQALLLVALLLFVTIAAVFGAIGEAVLGMIYTGVLGYVVGNFKGSAIEAQKQSAYRHRVTGSIEQLAMSYAALAPKIEQLLQEQRQRDADS